MILQLLTKNLRFDESYPQKLSDGVETIDFEVE